jgi:hypothetical protein
MRYFIICSLGKAVGTSVESQKYIQHFSRENSKKSITWEKGVEEGIINKIFNRN